MAGSGITESFLWGERAPGPPESPGAGLGTCSSSPEREAGSQAEGSVLVMVESPNSSRLRSNEKVVWWLGRREGTSVVKLKVEEWWWKVWEGGWRQFEVEEERTASCKSSLELRPNLDLGPPLEREEEVYEG